MRNIIRTSHDQRRRSSAALTDWSPPSPGANDALRRGSISALANSPLLVDSTGRRQSISLQQDGLPMVSETKNQASSGPTVSDLRNHTMMASHHSLYARRRTIDRTKHSQRQDATFSEIKNSSIIAMLVIILSCCGGILILKYFLKEWLT